VLQSTDLSGVTGTPFAQAVKSVAVSQIAQDAAPPHGRARAGDAWARQTPDEPCPHDVTVRSIAAALGEERPR
jgi:hypothetical protein